MSGKATSCLELSKPRLGYSWQLTSAGWVQELCEPSLVQTLSFIWRVFYDWSSSSRSLGWSWWRQMTFPQGLECQCGHAGHGEHSQLTNSHRNDLPSLERASQIAQHCRAVLSRQTEPILASTLVTMKNYLNTGSILFSISRAVSIGILLRNVLSFMYKSRGYFYLNIWHQNFF